MVSNNNNYEEHILLIYIFLEKANNDKFLVEISCRISSFKNKTNNTSKLVCKFKPVSSHNISGKTIFQFSIEN